MSWMPPKGWADRLQELDADKLTRRSRNRSNGDSSDVHLGGRYGQGLVLSPDMSVGRLDRRVSSSWAVSSSR